MTKPIIRIHNIETNEIIDREMTDLEYANYQVNQSEEENRQIEQQAKLASRQEILDRLGLSEEEAKLLLG